MDIRIRKLIMMSKALHTRDGIDRLYEIRKEGERGHVSIKDCVDRTIQKIE